MMADEHRHVASVVDASARCEQRVGDIQILA